MKPLAPWKGGGGLLASFVVVALFGGCGTGGGNGTDGDASMGGGDDGGASFDSPTSSDGPQQGWCARGEVFCPTCNGGGYCATACTTVACPPGMDGGLSDAAAADSGACASGQTTCIDCGGAAFCVGGACPVVSCPARDAGNDAHAPFDAATGGGGTGSSCLTNADCGPNLVCYAGGAIRCGITNGVCVSHLTTTCSQLSGGGCPCLDVPAGTCLSGASFCKGTDVPSQCWICTLPN
jgi:hypothetical protein